jgi:hypothetical protein
LNFLLVNLKFSLVTDKQTSAFLKPCLYGFTFHWEEQGQTVVSEVIKKKKTYMGSKERQDTPTRGGVLMGEHRRMEKALL